MAGYVPPQLVALIGSDLGAVDESSLRRLIGMPESQVLDAKRDLYGNSDSDKRELAADVAAFANRQGGLILVGVDEDKSTETITALAPIDDVAIAGEEVRMTQVVSARLAPVPVFEVRRVPVTGGAVLIVAVPPSTRRPHLLVVNEETLRVPLREGTHKRYLTESEIADLYRSRFADARLQVDRATERQAAFLDDLQWNRGLKAWLVATLQPERPGAFSVTHESAEPLTRFGAERQFPSWHQRRSFTVRPAFRSLRLLDAGAKVHTQTAVLYLDGGGTIGYAWEARESGDVGGTSNEVAWVCDEDLLGDLINGLQALAIWAMDSCSTSGDATLLVELHAPLHRSMGLHQYRALFTGRLEGTEDIALSTGLVTMTVSLDALRRNSTDLVDTARRVTSDLVSAFGSIGPPQLSAAGELRRQFFYKEKHGSLDQWAAAAGIPIVDI